MTTINLGDYLLERLYQLGVKSVFGVPGDFNLTFLDLMMQGNDEKDQEETKPRWIGCTNELNAGYAADGYSRSLQSIRTKDKNQIISLGAVVSTFGVGELSLMNALAGCKAERVPIISIVGVPSTTLQNRGALLHHTLGDGIYSTYCKATLPFVVASAFLTSVEGAVEEIDRVLLECLETAKPGYIALPTDLVLAPVSRKNLLIPIIPHSIAKSHEILNSTGEENDTLSNLVGDIVTLYESSKKPIILVDACTVRYGVQNLVKDLIEKTGVMFFTTPMGKSAISEEMNTFGGVYYGATSPEEIIKLVDSADLVILIGGISSDFNTGSFSYSFNNSATIEFHSDHTLIKNYKTEIGFHSLLPQLIENLSNKAITKESEEQIVQTRTKIAKVEEGLENEIISQAAFWPLIGQFLQEDDIIITETGTSSFGFLPVHLPKGAIALTQTLWGSIGWSVGALLGASIAVQDARINPNRRVILFIGDGSLQLTVQEISTMIRQGLKSIIFVLNNDGYTIERLIHGEEAIYNDIAPWNFQTLLSTLYSPLPSTISGGRIVKPISTCSKLAKTRKELKEILFEDKEFFDGDCLRLLEVRMNRLDAPLALTKQAKESARLNSE